jgi:hypothetical protein
MTTQRKFNNGDRVVFNPASRRSEVSEEIHRALERGDAVFIRNDGTVIPEVVDARGRSVGYAHETALLLFTEPTSVKPAISSELRATIGQLRKLSFRDMNVLVAAIVSEERPAQIGQPAPVFGEIILRACDKLTA